MLFRWELQGEDNLKRFRKMETCVKDCVDHMVFYNDDNEFPAFVVVNDLEDEGVKFINTTTNEEWELNFFGEAYTIPCLDYESWAEVFYDTSLTKNQNFNRWYKSIEQAKADIVKSIIDWVNGY